MKHTFTMFALLVLVMIVGVAIGDQIARSRHEDNAALRSRTTLLEEEVGLLERIVESARIDIHDQAVLIKDLSAVVRDRNLPTPAVAPIPARTLEWRRPAVRDAGSYFLNQEAVEKTWLETHDPKTGEVIRTPHPEAADAK